MRLSLLAIVAVLVLAGCNTERQNTFEKVLVRTPGVDNVDCDLYTQSSYYRVLTSRLVTIDRTDEPLTVVCNKSGYYTASVVVKPELHAPGMPLNLFNGMLPGAAVDIASNSIYEYPDTIIVTMLPMPDQKLPPLKDPYVTPLKPEPVKPAPVSSAPLPSAADTSMSKSLRK